jgi:hypothetical protein
MPVERHNEIIQSFQFYSPSEQLIYLSSELIDQL